MIGMQVLMDDMRQAFNAEELQVDDEVFAMEDRIEWRMKLRQ